MPGNREERLSVYGEMRKVRVAALLCLVGLLVSCGLSPSRSKLSATSGVTTTTTLPPVTVSPTLGVHAPVAIQCAGAVGVGQVRPATIDFCGDPGSVLHDIRWRSWGGSQAIGTGKGAHQGTQGWAAGTATVVAFDLGACDGHSAYQAMEWYFPGDYFDPSQYTDVCTNQYVDLTCLPYQDATSGLELLPRFGTLAVRDVICDGSDWATGTITTGTDYDVVGTVAFHRASSKWDVVATALSLPDGSLIPSDETAYCHDLVRSEAPEDMRCGS
jgi:hypothetical protein